MSKDAKKRKIIDCRLYPSEKNCSLAISGTEEEVLTLAVRHAIQEHGHQDTPELRQELKTLLKDA
jgi:predicted small metal-binding protein